MCTIPWIASDTVRDIKWCTFTSCKPPVFPPAHVTCVGMPQQVMSGFPHNGRDRGEHVLSCMQALGPNLHEDVVTLLDAAIPRLLAYLTGKEINAGIQVSNLLQRSGMVIIILGTLKTVQKVS